jgi:predicted ATPase
MAMGRALASPCGMVGPRAPRAVCCTGGWSPTATMLESLRLIDFKSFVDETIPFAPVTFLVGANAAGKSNVLDALRFLRGTTYDLLLPDILDGQEGHAPDAWKGIRGGAREAARQGMRSFEIRSSWRGVLMELERTAGQEPGTSGSHRIRVQVKPTVDLLEEAISTPDGQELFCVCRGADGRWVLTPPAPGSSLGAWDTEMSVLWSILGSRNGGEPPVSPEAAAVAHAVSEGIGRLAFKDIQPESMRELSHRGPPLRDDGANLSSVLYSLSRDAETRRTFIEWIAELCAPELADMDFIQVEELGDVMFVLVERDGRRISARSMSDGTLRFLGILTTLYTAEPDSVLCFEELGAGLHPARVRLLLELLETAHRERGIQTIVTTHSPSLLRWLPDERLGQAILLARTPDHPGTLARRLGDLPGFFDAVRSLGLEEMFGTQWLEAAL